MAESGFFVNATVIYGVTKVRIRIPCGDGRKSMKWLGLVAAQRFVMDAAARGRSRQRDRRSIAPAATQLVPSGCSTADEPFLHPAALICDTLEDGADVSIELEPRVRVAGAGQPVRSNWAIIAFTNHAAHVGLRQQALEEEFVKRQTRMRERAAATERAAAKDNEYKGSCMREMIRPQLLALEDLDPAVERAWAEMNRQNLMDSWIRNPRDQDKCKRLLRDNFLPLNELFKFYSACTQSAADAQQLEFVEFCAFARDIGIFGTKHALVDHAVLNTCFAESCEIPPQQVKGGHMQMYQFMSALVWLAQVTKSPADNDRKSPASALDAISKIVGASEKRTSVRKPGASGSAHGTHTADLLRRLISDNVGLALNKQRTQLIGIITKEQLRTDAVLARFYENHDALLGVYLTYLPSQPSFKVGTRAVDLNEGFMTMGEYHVLIEDSGLLESTDGKSDELTSKEVRQAFAGAQTEISVDGADAPPSKKALKRQATGGDKRGGERGANLGHAQLLSYAEFLEAILRLAMLKWEEDSHESDGVVRKVSAAIQMIVKNSHNNATKRPAGRRGTKVGLSRNGAAANSRA